jgi:hypothetical protein
MIARLLQKACMNRSAIDLGKHGHLVNQTILGFDDGGPIDLERLSMVQNCFSAWYFLLGRFGNGIFDEEILKDGNVNGKTRSILKATLDSLISTSVIVRQGENSQMRLNPTSIVQWQPMSKLAIPEIAWGALVSLLG